MKILFIIPLILLLAGCSKTGDRASEAMSGFIDVYDGSPFIGGAKGLLLRSDNSSQSWNGKGSVSLTQINADSASMLFRADFGNQRVINLMLRGQERGMDYRSGDADEPNFSIANNVISGKIDNATQKIIFEGNSVPNKIFMTMKVTFKEDVDNFTKGSVLTISFDTSRGAAELDDGKGCQMRMTPIWGPNGMTMGMVPDCD